MVGGKIEVEPCVHEELVLFIAYKPLTATDTCVVNALKVGSPNSRLLIIE